MSRIALTGGTGFVGGRLIDLATQAGHVVQALTRRPQPPRKGVSWVEGSLETPDALDRLVDGADAVIHVAGVVNAPDREGFARGNIAGTEAMLDAAQRGGTRRFVHVSSLAAREPGLSTYGWSKAEAEARVTGAALDWVMVRPPAIYGPGDLEMLDLFRMAKRGIALLPPGGRLSVIEVGDLGRLLLRLATDGPSGRVYEVDDAKPDGWSHREFAHAIGTAVDRRIAAFALPRQLMTAGAFCDRLVRGNGAKLTPDRVAYFCHPDWVVDPARRPDNTLWRPDVPTIEGLARTAEWYRAKGLL